METNYQTHRSIHKVKAINFNELDLEKQTLYLSINSNNLRLAVVNSKEAKCLYIEEFTLYSKEDTVSQLQEIFEGHSFLKAGYWASIKVAFAEGLFTLIPNEFFDASHNLANYLSLQSKAQETISLQTVSQNKVDAINIFEASNKVLSFLKEVYPKSEINFTHHTQVFIDAILLQYQQQEGIHVLVEHSQVLIAYIKEGQLEFCNSFTYNSYEDLLYYVMLVLDEQNLDNKKIEVYLYGKISTGSKGLDLLQKYIKHLNFLKEKPSWLKFDSNFEETSAHSYFDLFGFYIS